MRSKNHHLCFSPHIVGSWGGGHVDVCLGGWISQFMPDSVCVYVRKIVCTYIFNCWLDIFETL